MCSSDLDAAAGRVPAAVVAALGTTGTTAFDPLPEINQIAAEHGAWVHVDAAMAGSAMLLPECSALFDDYQFSRALESLWSLVAAVNKYIVENEPWAVAEKDDEQSRSRLGTILYTAAEALRNAGL